MATYQILRWSDIPVGVKAKDENGVVRVELHSRFQNAVDAVATATGRTETKVYLAGWTWEEPRQRIGTAGDVAAALADELDSEYTTQRMSSLRRELIARLNDEPAEAAGKPKGVPLK